MDIETVKRTVADMRRLADNPAATQGEIDNALRFIAKLMAQHHLSEEDIPKSQQSIMDDLDKQRVCKARCLFYGLRITLWEDWLTMLTARIVKGIKPFVCDNIENTFNNTVAAGAVFYGLEEDLLLARQLFIELHNLIVMKGRMHYGNINSSEGSSYCAGFVDGLRAVIEEQEAAEEKQESQQPGTALVVRRNAIVAKKMELVEAKAPQGSKRSNRSSIKDGLAFTHGHLEGRQHQHGSGRKKLGNS